MTWQDRLRKGSFRGVEFFTESSELEFGRRTAVYEVPGSEDGAGHVDNGRRAWRQSMTVFLLGVDYDIFRDDLIEAFERESGPGELVHPFYGKRNVVIDGPVRISESLADGGRASFTFTAVEVVDQGSLEMTLDPRARVRLTAIDAAAAIGDSFAETLDTTGENFVLFDVLDKIDSTLQDIRKVTAVVGTVLDAPSRLTAQLDAITRELTELINSPRALLAAIQGVLDQVKDSIRTLGNAIGSYGTGANLANEVGADIEPIDSVDTPNRRKQSVNSRLVKSTMRGLSLVAMADTATDFVFTDASQATTIRDQMVASFDSLLEDSDAATTTLDQTLQDLGRLDQPRVYQTLRALQGALYEYLSVVAGEATALSSYEPAEPLPSVVVAHLLYGDASRHAEIEARNGAISHPGFVAGGESIEVLAE